VSAETKQKLIKESQKRLEVAYKFSLILGFEEESGRLREEYIERLDKLLTTCDKCVYNWHMGRKAYLKELAE
jgi:senataxin